MKARFSSSWTDTKSLLEREIESLTGEINTEVVLEIAIPEPELKNGDWTQTSLKLTHPGIILSFESAYGPLRYMTDQFTSGPDTPGWHANVRAIALGLEALRKIDRYGISNGGEQYLGFRDSFPREGK